jgi:hypothetical protein
MPEIKIAELRQSGGTKNDLPVIVNLADDEEAMMTGAMNGCCSAIVLWNPDANGRYQNVRGHHADASPENIDWSQLLEGVPNDAAKAKLIIVCSPDNLNPADHYNYKNKVDKAVPTLFGRKVVCNLKPEFHGFTNGLVSREGTVGDFQKLNPEDYEIRQPPPVDFLI